MGENVNLFIHSLPGIFAKSYYVPGAGHTLVNMTDKALPSDFNKMQDSTKVNKQNNEISFS